MTLEKLCMKYKVYMIEQTVLDMAQLVNFILHVSHDMWLDEWIHVTPLLQSHIVAYMNYKV